MFGMKNSDPPDPNRESLYEDDFDGEPGAVRRGRRAVHREISPYSGDKLPRLMEKIEDKIKRNQAEKKFLDSKSPIEGLKCGLRPGVHEVIRYGYGKENVDPNFIKSELQAFDKAMDDVKNLESLMAFQDNGKPKTINELVEEKGFVLLQVTSDMVKGFNSSQDKASISHPSSPVPVSDAINDKGILGKSPVIQNTSMKSVAPSVTVASPEKLSKPSISSNDEVMKDLLNEYKNLGGDFENNLKIEQGVNFLNLKWDKEMMNMDDFSKLKISQAAKMASTLLGLSS
ncbi:unnamed protein product [Lactuca virosa]|uniref:Uncharacterized protein n=1 Tax=Lactuca virosa TaxID=75947 RepID=A0AAU9MTK0_9ASTR|nr:unnamed protein product [Lactuca virosa]